MPIYFPFETDCYDSSSVLKLPKWSYSIRPHTLRKAPSAYLCATVIPC